MDIFFYPLPFLNLVSSQGGPLLEVLTHLMPIWTRLDNPRVSSISTNIRQTVVTAHLYGHALVNLSLCYSLALLKKFQGSESSE